ncbi:unnamed protein product [Bursaphelenchus okinawaensis]|uniref:Microtubule-associated protein n=1 Tax=Bursaphelenchus okinawaensis TaxID=465554 RepID=A0A811KGZ3_9BILA|nr:unnamed protein product [Bursaphelenchus okinawaensis]CAG9103122.1 unnamed protein product [Bursaphelenchus okinawaensis]
MQCSRTVESFGEIDLTIPLNDDFENKDSARSEVSYIKLSVSPDPDSSCSIDINSNLNSPNTISDGEPIFPHRRRSSRLSSLKSELIESGAIFRPPFTPSNSLTRMRTDLTPREQIAQAFDVPPSPPSRASSRMRSASVRPGSQASSASNASKREPSLPPMKNRYAHVKSRVDSHSSHKPPPSQVKILNKPVKVEARSRIGSLANIQHVPGGGDKRIPTQKLDFKARAAPRIDFGARDSSVTGSASSSRPPSTTPSHSSRNMDRNATLKRPVQA